MAGRPSNAEKAARLNTVNAKRPNATEAPDGKPVEYFDQLLIVVNREPSAKGPVTKSVSIREVIREKMPSNETLVTALNAAQDHQNISDQGNPQVIWLFPAGMATVGEEYKANDIYATILDEETGKEERITKHDGTYKIIGLNVTDKKIASWETGAGGNKRGKPVYAE